MKRALEQLGSAARALVLLLVGAVTLGGAVAAPIVAYQTIKVNGTRGAQTLNFTGASSSTSGNTTTIALGTVAGDVDLGSSTRTYTSSVPNGAAGSLVIKSTSNLTNAGAFVEKWVHNTNVDLARVDAGGDGATANGGRFNILTSAGYVTAVNEVFVGTTALSGFLDITANIARMSTAGGYIVQLEVGAFRNDNDTLVTLGTPTKRWKRVHLGGTSHVAGDFALSAGWGSTASVGTITGSDPHGRFVVTSAGTGQGANPTITLTFKDLTWTNAPFCTVNTAATSVAADVTAKVTWVESATTLVITWNGTPTATRTYTFAFKCDG